MPEERLLVFKHGEQEQLVRIKLNQTADVPEGPNAVNDDSKGSKDKDSESSSEMEDDEAKVFKIVLDRPRPEGVRIARQNELFVEIVSNDNALVAADEIQ